MGQGTAWRKVFKLFLNYKHECMKTFRKSFIKKKLLKETSAKETFRESFIKAQSAMEYLMTYGWAILIIAIVLAALFQLGVFNPMAFAPKAPPGSCQVFRPNGPGTTQFINLEGICTGEIPQYVATSGSNTGSIVVPSIQTAPLNGVTLVFYWINTTKGSVDTGIFSLDFSSGYSINAYLPQWWGEGPGSICVYTLNPSGQNIAQVTLPTFTSWQQIAITYNASSNLLRYYRNGIQLAGYTPSNTLSLVGPIKFSIPLQYSWISIANVQIYNTSLSANDIQALYLEGIGGAPIDLQNLVGWWPLNGNANDYSGNGNNGQINNVNFVGNWYSGYTPP